MNRAAYKAVASASWTFSNDRPPRPPTKTPPTPTRTGRCTSISQKPLQQKRHNIILPSFEQIAANAKQAPVLHGTMVKIFLNKRDEPTITHLAMSHEPMYYEFTSQNMEIDMTSHQELEFTSDKMECETLPLPDETMDDYMMDYTYTPLPPALPIPASRKSINNSTPQRRQVKHTNFVSTFRPLSPISEEESDDVAVSLFDTILNVLRSRPPSTEPPSLPTSKRARMLIDSDEYSRPSKRRRLNDDESAVSLFDIILNVLRSRPSSTEPPSLPTSKRARMLIDSDEYSRPSKRRRLNDDKDTQHHHFTDEPPSVTDDEVGNWEAPIFLLVPTPTVPTPVPTPAASSPAPIPQQQLRRSARIAENAMTPMLRLQTLRRRSPRLALMPRVSYVGMC